MPNPLHELFSVGSRLINVICGGVADMTFSARVHMDGWRRAERFIDWVFWVLRGEERHCEVWFRADVRRAAELLEASVRMKRGATDGSDQAAVPSGH